MLLNALLLVLVTFSVSAQSVLKKSYNVKTGHRGAFLFSAVSVLFAALFFLALSGGRLTFTMAVVPYALGFALSYGLAVLMSFLAIRCGSLSLTSLVTSYSLVIPTLYGLAFLGEKVGILFYIGLALLFISLFMMNGARRESKISLPWVAATFLAFLGNGICSTVQTVQQKTFAGQYKSEMMVLALLFVAAVMLLLALLFERDEILPAMKSGGARAALCGLLNGLCNLLVMHLAVRMNASIMFPVISAGGILLTGAASLFVYRERLSRGQSLALLLGTAAIVLMSI